MNMLFRGPVLAVALAAVVVGPVLATAGAGFHQTIQSRATVDGRIHAKGSEIKLDSKGPVDFVTVTLVIDPLATSGWHTHPGVVIVSVASGSLTFYDEGCNATVHAAGSAFVESGDDPGLVRNLSATTPATVNATYIVPAGTPNASLRIDKDNPGCPQS
jgi:quercetin dioxygenase-like cupin family protein